jgi:protein-S-isoprenylcysteine O-methyltransferase Ste14
MIDKEKTKKRMGKFKWSELGRTEKIVLLITHVIIMPLTIIYSIFLPLKLGTVWLYVGLPICILALLMGFMGGIAFATAPLDEPITRGVYRISRHPMYFSGFLLYLGIAIACASWIFLVCAVVWIVSMHFGTVSEERELLEKYGDAYRKYMDSTPRWIGIPKSGERD